jgi:alkanesulfonate monooxygenase SsuD/methylene tetrahydromethanopterin reductase-like flavin-dependent oxidoreductase (luciferase family)
VSSTRVIETRVTTLGGVPTPTIRFGVQADITSDARAWLELARKVEALGYDALYVADHPGVTASPFAALAAAASVTSTLKLGTYVCNVGVREPVALASDAATVDVVSNGRLILGLGAGHTPTEWTMNGSDFPSARARVGRLGEMVDVVSWLLAGEVVAFDGQYVRTDSAFLLAPRPAQLKVPLLVGGNGKQLLRIAGSHADIVSMTASAAPSTTATITAPTGVASRSTSVSPSCATESVNATWCSMRSCSTSTSPTTLLAWLSGSRAPCRTSSYVIRVDAIDIVAPLLDRLRTQVWPQS